MWCVGFYGFRFWAVSQKDAIEITFDGYYSPFKLFFSFVQACTFWDNIIGMGFIALVVLWNFYGNEMQWDWFFYLYSSSFLSIGCKVDVWTNCSWILSCGTRWSSNRDRFLSVYSTIQLILIVKKMWSTILNVLVCKVESSPFFIEILQKVK